MTPTISSVMRKSLLPALAAGIALGQPVFVSSLNGAKLYEQNHRGQLTFTLENGMPEPITFFAIEVWGTASVGPPRKCSIREGAYVRPGSRLVIANRCAIALDVKTGKAIDHASTVTEVGLANGHMWKRPRSIP